MYAGREYTFVCRAEGCFFPLPLEHEKLSGEQRS